MKSTVFIWLFVAICYAFSLLDMPTLGILYSYWDVIQELQKVASLICLVTILFVPHKSRMLSYSGLGISIIVLAILLLVLGFKGKEDVTIGISGLLDFHLVSLPLLLISVLSIEFKDWRRRHVKEAISSQNAAIEESR